MLATLHAYINSHCILRAEPGRTLVNKAGKDLTWLFDLRPLLLDAKQAAAIAVLFWDDMQPQFERQPFQLAAMEIAGIPLMSALLAEAANRGLDISGLIIRKKRKKSGTQQSIEGAVKPLPVVLIDDSANSYASMNHALVVLRDAGLRVSQSFVVIDFHSKMGVAWGAKSRVERKSLFSLSDFDLPFNEPFTPKTDYEVVWTFAAPRPKLDFAVPKSSPVIWGDSILFGSESAYFWCLDRLTGRINWWHGIEDKTGKGIVSAPVIDGDSVYYGAYAGSLHRMDAKTGEPVWVRKPCDWIGSSPCVAGGKVFIGLEYKRPTEADSGGAVACFDAANGDMLWEHRLTWQQHSSPVYSAAHDAVVTGANDCKMLCLDAQTGAVRAERATKGPIKYHPALWGDCAVMAAFDGIYVWDFVKDEVRFLQETEDLNYTRPLVVGDRAFVGSSDENMYVIDLLTMTLIEKIPMGEKVHSSPTLINGVVYFGTSAGLLIGMDPLNLEIVEQYQFPERLTNAVVTDGNLWFVYTYDNKMWAIRK